MIGAFSKHPVEVTFSLAMVAILLVLSLAFGLPVIFPSGGSASFVGIHYLYPLLGLGVWGLFALLGQKKQLASVFLIALPCYAIVLLVHFNIKLWVPYINPIQLDGLYWSIDQMFRPIVDACMALRRALDPIIPVNDNFYMIGFIALFYVSFCYHALWTPHQFRKLFIAALLFQGLGALAYIPFPALGPFLYEQGMNPLYTGAQQGMLGFHRDLIANGPTWLAVHGPPNLTAGLAAMPSLHTGGAFLFFLFAWRYGKVLIPLYSFLLFFILVAAVSTRWHYLIDIPIGLALGWFSIWLAEKLVPVIEHAAEPEITEPIALLAPPSYAASALSGPADAPVEPVANEGLPGPRPYAGASMSYRSGLPAGSEDTGPLAR